MKQGDRIAYGAHRGIVRHVDVSTYPRIYIVDLVDPMSPEEPYRMRLTAEEIKPESFFAYMTRRHGMVGKWPAGHALVAYACAVSILVAWWINIEEVHGPENYVVPGVTLVAFLMVAYGHINDYMNGKP